jgi:hypothetical protein
MISADSSTADDFAVSTIRRTFLRAADSNFLEDLIAEQRRSGVAAAIRRRDTKGLFRWLMTMLSYQGISNRAAEQFMDKHGYVTWSDVEAIAAENPPCPKLSSYWHFEGCNYRKTACSCARHDLRPDCHLPDLPLRNGHLNQTAASLYMFIRDIADGDFVGWVDRRLHTHDHLSASERAAALIEPLRHVYGVSHKVLSMLLSAMLLGAKRRRLWFETGASLVVIDTLVHNYLHRTGILRFADAEHPYGPRCYGANGCASIIQAAAIKVDASVFGPEYPPAFPRFVQAGLWRFCAMDGLDVCNGNRVDDRRRCGNRYCPNFTTCERVNLSAKNLRNRPFPRPIDYNQ